MLPLLERKDSPCKLIPQLLRARTDQGDPQKAQEARLLLAILSASAEAGTEGDPSTPSLERMRLHADLHDGVVRCAPVLGQALAALLPRLEPSTWWALYEATQTLTREHGGEPYSEAVSLRERAAPKLHPYLIAESLILHAQGWGDDALRSAKAFVETARISPGDFLAAHSVLPLAVNRRWRLRHAIWPVISLPPIENSLSELSPHLLTSVEIIPATFGFIRGWSIRDVLKPFIQSNPFLLPEVLACALGDSGQRSSRDDLFTTFAPELMRHPQPAQEIHRRVQEVADPYHRARGLLRLASHWPDHRPSLLQEAATIPEQVTETLPRLYLLEWLYTTAEHGARDSLFTSALETAQQIPDPDNRARAFGRLGIASTEDRARACFQAAFQTANQIEDEFARATTIRLLRRGSSGFPDLDATCRQTVRTISDPIQEARAAEDWQAVVRLLRPHVRQETDHRELWALLTLAAEVEPEKSFHRDEAELWRQLATNPTAEAVTLMEEMTRTSLLELTPVAAQTIEELLHKEEVEVVEAIYPRFRAVSLEVVPFLQRLRSSPSPRIANLSCLLLTELQGLDAQTVRGLTECLIAADDLTGNRAGEKLYGGPQEPIFRASLIGREALDFLFEAGSDDSSSRRNRIGHTVTWFCERLLYDAEAHVAAWGEALRHQPDSRSAKRGLKSIHFVDESGWRQLLKELDTGPVVVQEHVLQSMAHLARHDRLKDGRWEALQDLMAGHLHGEIGWKGGLHMNLTSVRGVLQADLTANHAAESDEHVVSRLREALMATDGFRWGSLFDPTREGEGLTRLKQIGVTLFTSRGNEVDRWAYAMEIAKPGMQHPGFLERLALWVTQALTTSLRDVPFFNPERGILIELLAGAASSAPARFHSLQLKDRLRPLLAQATIEHNYFTGRSDSVRLLGYLRHLTVDLLPALRSALADVQYVREGAIEAMSLFRRLDPEVLPEIQKWLFDESRLVAFASARLLTSIGRHTQLAGRNDRTATMLRREIIRVFADAVRDPRSYRPLDFGPHSVPTPDIPMLCDFFLDCLLKVAGYDEPLKLQETEKAPVIRQAVATSDRVIIEGRRVPYSLSIPNALIKAGTTSDLIEHFYQSPDGLFSFHVVAVTQREDPALLLKGRLQANAGKDIKEARVESTQTVTVRGTDWMETRLLILSMSGSPAREISRMMSYERGTIVVTTKFRINSDEKYSRLAETMLASFEVAK